ncbi:hypothetical protein BDM02DRAFT_3117111 [Thelephora ganbajun]|uniref:Uncharacterized protein n=1 Tax=Thelephora ganbajun TaxID=370292 RepID=A0ACB6ZDK7_THEGA|nr:hypothetical protein BDM02DRAFT_3117111 [Thelephora ganbajun]
MSAIHYSSTGGSFTFVKYVFSRLHICFSSDTCRQFKPETPATEEPSPHSRQLPQLQVTFRDPSSPNGFSPVLQKIKRP